MASNSKSYLAPCNGCCRETRHKVLKEKTTTFHDEDCGHCWDTFHRMIECLGCGYISLQKTVTSTAYDGVDTQYFPPPFSRKKPDWAGDIFTSVPQEIDELVDEVYAALHAKSHRLAAMGARTILDIAITDKVKDVGGFVQKLDVLESEGFIAKMQRATLEATLDVGNAASHRGHCPSVRALNHVLDIVETIIAQLYIHPESASELSKSTPKRKKANKP